MLRFLQGNNSPAVAPLPGFKGPPPADYPVPAWRAAALALPDGAALGEALAAELQADMARRAADAALHWSVPALSDLRVRHSAVTEEWIANRNLFLAAPDATTPPAQTGMDGRPTTDCVVAVGAGVHVHQTHVSGSNALLAVGDGTRFAATTLCAFSGATVLVGERTTSTFMASVDGRNGGRVLIGADGMWAHGVRIISDDMHAIRDVATNRRVNRRGGTVVIEPHVWLSEQVMLMADVRIGRDAVIGAASIVKNLDVPANTVCGGRPLRLLRTGTTWSREDLP